MNKHVLFVVFIGDAEALALLVLVPALAIGPDPTPFEPIGAKASDKHIFTLVYIHTFYVYQGGVGSRFAQGRPTPPHPNTFVCCRVCVASCR